jgi:branched-chain amino acid transport system ATP-binding protein
MVELADALPSEGPAALELNEITAGYGRIDVLRAFSIKIRPGQVVAMLGPNGIGKTTAMRVAAGLLQPTRGAVLVGGKDLTSSPPHVRAKAGLCLIPEGRGIFRSLSVAENLRLQIPSWVTSSSFEPAIEAFPRLGNRLHQRAGSMSGGEQQMLAIARAYLSSPKVVLFDEVSMGLAPILVSEVFAAIRRLADMGTTLLIVEQYVQRALEIADEICLLDRGTVSFFGPPSALDEEALVGHYLASRVEVAQPAGELREDG